ncbi:MAG: N-acetylmuramoyl-L-alanine amidase, partial [Verrucomicrobia bacterium]|nr:N-acetylmuramoyl-L-alanine amidase [Verrucomicrobiota bacterium]
RASIFLREKDLTLETAKRVRDELRRAGLRTVMTREDDHFVELDDQVRLTRNPEIPCILCECAYVTNPAEAQKVSMESYRRRIASGIAQGILEEHKLGDAGIAPVPELSAPLSRGSDKYQTHTTRRSHGHS